MGWAPHKTSTKSSLVSGPIPPKNQYLEVGDLSQDISQQIYLLSWVLTLLLVYLVYDYWMLYEAEKWQKNMDY